MAVNHGYPGGVVLPVETLRARVTAMVGALCRCEWEVGATLPGLIRDLRASVVAGRDVAELLKLSAWLHTQATVPWLRIAGNSLDLREQAIMLVGQATGEHGTPAPIGLAAAGASVALEAAAFGLARAGLDAVTMPTNTPEMMQLAGFFALRGSVVAAADRRSGDVDASLAYATELAARTGEGNAYGLSFGPTNVGRFRVAGLVEIGDYERAVSTAEGLNPDAQDLARQAYYWIDYGQALARLRGRHDDAVRAFRRAEAISPHRVLRDPIVRDVLAVLLRHARRSSPADQELRDMARRAGLPA
jgi:hypothetical protein